MNDIVYPVHGGMEDWAYASSWSPKVVSGGCDPSTYGGYDKALTKYNDGVLRSLTILVEASKIKRPSKKNLGSESGERRAKRSEPHKTLKRKA